MKKILVIEDNFEVRDNLCEILELAGYHVLSAENGKIGTEKAMQELPDLILCDVMMPELDGFGVLKILQKNQKTHDIPFIFLTAKAEKSDFRKGMGLGADDYITKPFDDTELLEAIEIRLSKREHLQSIFDQSDRSLQQFFSEARAKASMDQLSMDRELRKYQRKDPIYEEGHNARWLFFVVSGKVKVSQINDFGKELITHIYNAGDFFGYFPLLKGTTYTDNAYAMEDTTLRLIPHADFTLLLFNNRDFAAQFIKMVANKADETEQQLIELAYSSVRRRVATALLSHIADQENGNDEPVIHVSRDDLAATAGTAKETLIRTLSDFRNEGLIAIDGQSIQILNRQGIRTMPQ